MLWKLPVAFGILLMSCSGSSPAKVGKTTTTSAANPSPATGNATAANSSKGTPTTPSASGSDKGTVAGTEPASDGDTTAAGGGTAGDVPAAGGASDGLELTGHLEVAFTMVGPAKAGPFRNNGHVRAVWLTDSANKLIRTLDYHAAKRAQYLRRFNTFAQTTIDGTTGATDKSLATNLPVTASWDLKDKAGVVLKGGSYKIWFEMAEADVNTALTGNITDIQAIDSQSGYAFHIVPFTLDAEDGAISDAKSPVFTAITLHHVLD